MIIVNNTEKQQLVVEMLNTYTATVDLENVLWLGNNPKDATRVEKKNDEMEQKIKVLRGELWADWTGSADALTQQIQARNADLDNSINILKADVHDAEQVVKVLSYVDEVIGVAASLLV